MSTQNESLVWTVNQMNFQEAWLNQESTSFGLLDDPEPLLNSDNSDWDNASDGQAATLTSEPHPGSDLSLGSLYTGYSRNDWSPAALSEVEQPCSTLTLILNHQSSVFFNAEYQVSKVLSLEPQSDNHLDVLSHAAFSDTAQSLWCMRCWTLKQKVYHLPLWLNDKSRQINIAAVQ